jgi:pimeloyl-ACP methyl ester carboxylesterase
VEVALPAYPSPQPLSAWGGAPRPGEVRYLLAGTFYRMAWVEFGDPEATPLICVHGMTRNGRDFDVLARALSDRFHVICPDLPGRGESDWLPDTSLYQPQNYVIALAHLLARIGRPAMMLGTSLGGICAIAIASAIGQPLTRMVLNDVGPQIPAAALRRIRDYVARQPVFPDMPALEAHLREVHATFGPLTDPQWEMLARHSGRLLEDGRVMLHYDPGIGKPMRGPMIADIDIWPWWDKIRIPVMAIRGEHSDLLLPRILARMARSGADILEVPDAGHAPALMDTPTIEAIRAFLEQE